MDKKGKNKQEKKIFPSLIKIQFLSEILSEVYESFLFKIYLKSFLLNKNLKLGQNNEIQVFQQKYLFLVTEASFIDNNNKITEFEINEDTVISLENLEASLSKLNLNNVNIQSFDNRKMKVNEKVDIIGLDKEINKLSSILEYNLLQENNTQSQEIKFIKGILIQGPSGTGKSFLVKYLSRKFEKQVSFFELKNSDLTTNNKEKDDKIKNIFKIAKISRPSIIFIDEIDRMFPKNNEDDYQQKTLSSFMIEYDNLLSSDKIMVLATTNNVEGLDSSIKKGGRFDISINMSIFSKDERKVFIEKYLNEFNNNLNENDIEILTDKTHGFVASDILSLFKDSLLKAYLNSKDKSNIVLARQDLEESLLDIKPISLKDIILEIPKVYWKDIGGNKETIKRIRQSVEWPLKNKSKFEKFGIKPSNIQIISKLREFFCMDLLDVVKH